MNRREFLITSSAAAGLLALQRFASAAAGTIDLYSGSDANIVDLWNNIIRLAFEKAHPGVALKVTDAGDNNGLRAIADRALAALKTKTDPQADLFEQFDPRLPSGGIDAGLWVKFSAENIEGYDHINPLALDTPYSLPYRGSQVLLAYDTTKLDPKDAPKSWEQLTTWIKANPGQFIYNRPDKGGSGGNFVRRAIHEANGRDPKKFKIDNYTADFGTEALTPAWKILTDLAPSLYDKGAYTSGNTQSIQLLAQGVVTMVPVWSDQVLQAIAQGVLPETTGLVQLGDLALCGGFSSITVFSNGANKDAALKLAAFMLTTEMQEAIITGIGGFPAVSWDHISDDLRKKYADVIPSTIPTFPAGDWEKAINDGWYRSVAPNISRT
ncbi:ABC transporter substrate-binding protein [Rhizobium lentis]|uniref:extracellular solute-binding protein n=1 Tax=Rhizobium lentis TaxID=1138194 RepID=UPI001C834A4C|nr:extracellular solute-binding protein [Rhizobium lentis]MBX5039268.1 ABC transporter substrate-binding protein [Rhizobium lentis]MBX5052342.1 ABC transporter substrate-binding protein [Rhizobium lentis]MBX5071995.1 ABC transporter substrate-binding protein [Rhizobium lentis]MBX5109210.1 ABC transporter substrate-binding protein [Rhizobium lentis]MBX5114186.1 ABC transporter substrate-binding protein [Rhizobium lentis]